MERISVTKNVIHIEGSYCIPKAEFETYIFEAHLMDPENLVTNNRKMVCLKMEWAAHNLLYSLGIRRDRTADVDLEYPTSKGHVFYHILGLFALLVVK